MHFTIQKGADGLWRWWLVAGNGKELGKSSRPYTSRKSALSAVRNIIADIHRREIRVVWE
jgi:uncharacterized protein YegP (UPF0339 family)